MPSPGDCRSCPYPFCTIEPNLGGSHPDPRLEAIAKVIEPEK